MGTGKFNAGGNPAMDYSYSLNATETGISSALIGHLGSYTDFTPFSLHVFLGWEILKPSIFFSM